MPSLSSLKKDLQLFERALDGNSSKQHFLGAASCSHSIAEVYYKKHLYDEAIPYYGKQLKYADAQGDLADAGDAHNRLGICMGYINRYEEALGHLNNYQRIAENTNDPLAQQMAMLNIGLCYFWRASGGQHPCDYFLDKDLKKALKRFELSLELARKLKIGSLARFRDCKPHKLTKDRKDEAVATSQMKIGAVYIIEEEYTKAISHYAAALELLPSGHDLLGECWQNLGIAYREIGEFRQAEKYLMRDMELTKRDSFQSDHGDCLRQVAELYIKQAKWNEALKYAKKFVKAAENFPTDESNLETAKDVVAHVKNLIDNDNRIPVLRNELRDAREKNDYYKECELLVQIAELYDELDNKDTSLEFYEGLQEVTEKKVNGGDPQIVKFLSEAYIGIADCYSDMKKYKPAIIILKKVIPVLQKLDDHETLCVVYMTLGNCYINAKLERNIALKHYKKAEDLSHKFTTEFSDELTRRREALANIGEIYYHENAKSEAEKTFERVRQLDKKIEDAEERKQIHTRGESQEESELSSDSDTSDVDMDDKKSVSGQKKRKPTHVSSLSVGDVFSSDSSGDDCEMMPPTVNIRKRDSLSPSPSRTLAQPKRRRSNSSFPGTCTASGPLSTTTTSSDRRSVPSHSRPSKNSHRSVDLRTNSSSPSSRSSHHSHSRTHKSSSSRSHQRSNHTISHTSQYAQNECFLRKKPKHLSTGIYHSTQTKKYQSTLPFSCRDVKSQRASNPNSSRAAMCSMPRRQTHIQRNSMPAISNTAPVRRDTTSTKKSLSPPAHTKPYIPASGFSLNNSRSRSSPPNTAHSSSKRENVSQFSSQSFRTRPVNTLPQNTSPQNAKRLHKQQSVNHHCQTTPSGSLPLRLSSVTPKVSKLTPEQLKRIAENKKKAEETRLRRMGKTALIPKTKTSNSCSVLSSHAPQPSTQLKQQLKRRSPLKNKSGSSDANPLNRLERMLGVKPADFVRFPEKVCLAGDSLGDQEYRDKEKIGWFYRGEGESWIPFDFEASNQIDEFYLHKNVLACIPSRGYFAKRRHYQIDFTKTDRVGMFAQTNTKTGFKRDISRRLLVSPNAEVTSSKLPRWVLKNWKDHQINQNLNVATISRASQEFSEVVHRFRQGGLVEEHGYHVREIQRIQNRSIARGFLISSLEMGKRILSQERLLFHGTDKSAIQGIINQGFDPRLSGKHAVRFGQGSYFSTDSTYSSNFCTEYSNSFGQKCKQMILARVLVGRYAIGDKNTKRPPPIDPNNPNGYLYDSCVNSLDKPSIFVIFDQKRAYPAYLITFYRQRS